MRNKLVVAIALCSVLATGISWSGAAELLDPRHHCPGGDHCNCPMVEEWVWQNVVCHRCKMVEEKKPIKKTVYDYKEVPFCLKELPKIGHCEDCVGCECVRYKRVLIKKEIVCGEQCVTRCVPEEYIERKQVKICRPACQAAAPCTLAPVAGGGAGPAPVIVDPAPVPPAPAK